MYYQGENINIIIKGDSNIDLNQYNFTVLVYNHYDESNDIIEITKAQSEEIEPNTYSVEIPFATTMGLSTGQYDIEICVIENNDRRSVFKKNNAFTLNPSKSKDLPIM